MLYRNKENAIGTGQNFSEPSQSGSIAGQLKSPSREIHQSLEHLHSRIRDLHDRITGVEGQFSPVCRDPSPTNKADVQREVEGSFCDVGRNLDQAISGVKVAIERLESLIDRSQV